jgi:hypothetical protein
MKEASAPRYAFCDFSKIVGFPNPLPDRDEWEDILPEFQAKSWEVPAEHLLDFHEVIHRLNIMHEDVQINLFRYSLGGAALDWCQSLPTASINSLTGFHTAFNSFCKDYFPAECLYENCCDEFSLLHEASAGPEDHVCDEAFTVEESIFYENLEALNDIHYVIPSTEASDIISDTSVLLDVHKDQRASCENSEFIEQMLSTVDSSPGYGVEANVPSSPAYDVEDLPIFKEEMVVEEDSSLFLQEVSHDIFLPRIKEKNHMYEQPEAAVTVVPEMDIFNSYILDGIIVLEVDHRYEGQPLFDEYSSDDEQQAYPTFDHYEDTDRHDNKKRFPMVPIYDDYESDPWESQEEEEPEEQQQNGQFISCLESASEQPPPEISQPVSTVHPPVPTRDIQPYVNNGVAEEVACHQFSGVFRWSYEPVKEYMELYFLHNLELPYFISTSALRRS